MGQNQVKIKTSDHTLVFKMIKSLILQIYVYASQEDRSQHLEYYDSFYFKELQKQVREEFGNMKTLYKSIKNSTKTFCHGSGTGKYNLQFLWGNVILHNYYHDKQLTIKVKRMNGEVSSYSSTAETDSQIMVSLEDILLEMRSQRGSQNQHCANNDEKNTKQQSTKMDCLFF